MGLCTHLRIGGMWRVVYDKDAFRTVPHGGRNDTTAHGFGSGYGRIAGEGNTRSQGYCQAETYFVVSGFCRLCSDPCGNRQSGWCGLGYCHWRSWCRVLDVGYCPDRLGNSFRGVYVGSVVQEKTQGLIHWWSCLLYPTRTAQALDGHYVCHTHHMSVWLI